MKSRLMLYALIALLALVLIIFWFNYSTNDPESMQLFPAAVNRDCAPWDGAAFTISIPYDSVSTIQVSIWQPPEIKRSTAFSFPDETGRVGNAVRLSQLGSPEQLSGTVFIHGAEQGIPMEGEFDLFTEAGRQFNGKFIANWGDFSAMCG